MPIDETLSLNYSEQHQTPSNHSSMVGYNAEIHREFRSNQTYIHSHDNSSNNVYSLLSEPYVGSQIFSKSSNEFQESLSIETSTVFPPDEREVIDDTTEYPWRTICKLYITAEDNSQFIGSGAIIDESHVLTCGHCVYLHEHGGWASQIKVVPGKDQSFEPFGHGYAKTLRTYSGWTEGADPSQDWALITLDRSLGEHTGWMGRKTANPFDSIYSDILNTAGYPGDLDNGERLYRTSGAGAYATEYRHYYKLDLTGGQSGSPVWNYDGENRYILSIVAYSSRPNNFGPRLTQTKLDSINDWIQEDGSDPPSDSPDLVGRGEGFYEFYPSIIRGESDILTIEWDVNNIGSSSSQTFKINYYLTEDKTLTSEDYYLGSSNVSEMSPLNYRTIQWEGNVQYSIPGGEYYIGWVIDPTDQVSELDESNNNIIIESAKLTVMPRFLFRIEFWTLVFTILFILGLTFVVLWHIKKSIPEEIKVPLLE